MENKPVVMLSIVKDGLASKFVEEARKVGVTGATIIRAEGTISNRFMNMLGLHDVDREVIISVVPNDIHESVQIHMNDKMELDKKGNGVLFSFYTSSCKGNEILDTNLEEDLEKMPGHQLVVTIVERGLGDEVVETARGAGAVGATIIHGRGVGTHEKARIFNIQIEPEKEVVFMVVDNDAVQRVNDAITQELEIEDPGHGLLFTLDVNQTSGLFKENN